MANWLTVIQYSVCYLHVCTQVISRKLLKKLVTVIVLGKILMAGEKGGDFIPYLFPFVPFEY